jgi:hypothetical protein
MRGPVRFFMAVYFLMAWRNDQARAAHFLMGDGNEESVSTRECGMADL